MKYNRSTWKKIRNSVLIRDGYICQYYKRYGLTKEATTVHHIFPVENYPYLKYKKWNLISLSSEAHNKMHDRYSHKITKDGRDLQDRIREKYEKYCREKGIEPKYY